MSRLSGHYGTQPLANKHKYKDYFKYKYKYVQIQIQLLQVQIQILLKMYFEMCKSTNIDLYK